MEFPFIIEAYKSTKSGDKILESIVVKDEHELQNFTGKYIKNLNLKFRSKEIPSSEMNDEFKQKIISLIKEQVEKIGSVGVMRTIKEVTSSSYAVYAPEIESISATIVKSKNYIRTKNGNDYFISLNPEKKFVWWQTFNNIWTPLLAAFALAFSLYTHFMGQNRQRKEELKIQELKLKMQSLDSTLKSVQTRTNYLLKEKAQRDSAKNGENKTL